jgi:hypothetical protein
MIAIFSICGSPILKYNLDTNIVGQSGCRCGGLSLPLAAAAQFLETLAQD